MKAIISKKENNTPKRTKNSKFKKIMASVSFAYVVRLFLQAVQGIHHQYPRTVITIQKNRL